MRTPKGAGSQPYQGDVTGLEESGLRVKTGGNREHPLQMQRKVTMSLHEQGKGNFINHVCSLIVLHCNVFTFCKFH